MEQISHNPPSMPDMGYSQSVEVRSAERTLWISGQVPQDAEGNVPEDIEGQCRLAWANVLANLQEAGMDYSNLVKVTMFLSDRQYRKVSSDVREELLGGRRPALTVIITGIYSARWLLEIEAVACA